MDQFAQGRLRFKFAIAGGLVVVAALSIKQAHRYVIRVYALDRLVDSSAQRVSKQQLAALVKGHVLAEGQVTGIYVRDHN